MSRTFFNRNHYFCVISLNTQGDMNQIIYPIGIQNFEKIRRDSYLYIDKTFFFNDTATTETDTDVLNSIASASITVDSA